MKLLFTDEPILFNIKFKEKKDINETYNYEFNNYYIDVGQ